MIEIRRADLKDIGSLTDLLLELIRYLQREAEEPYFQECNLSEEAVRQKIEDDLSSDLKAVYVAVHGAVVTGFISGEVIDCFLPISTIGKIGYISGAFVLEEYRKQGIMKKLETAISAFFKEKQVSYVELNVLTQNSAGKQSWEHLGFETFREQMRKRL